MAARIRKVAIDPRSRSLRLVRYRDRAREDQCGASRADRPIAGAVLTVSRLGACTPASSTVHPRSFILGRSSATEHQPQPELRLPIRDRDVLKAQIERDRARSIVDTDASADDKARAAF